MADFVPVMIFIIVIVAIVGGTANSIVSKVLDYKKSQRALPDSGERDQETVRLTERTDYLEERVRVLERIATDKDRMLAQEIEDLRDAKEPG